LRSISQKKQHLKSILNNLSTIIFDLGGVLINLDTSRSVNSFGRLSGLSEEEVYAKFLDDGWSYAFEKGEIDSATFRNEVRKSLGVEISDNQIDQAWNEMLLDIPSSRLQMVADLRNKYQLFVLSNTNAIHIETFNRKVAALTNGGIITDYFDKVYYSNELGMRKPDTEIFSFVIDENNIKPQETLFIDDMEDNIIGAQSVGLKTVHLSDQDYLTELFS
jgi:epoxide hydrolase-like predicted phosphatase